MIYFSCESAQSWPTQSRVRRCGRKWKKLAWRQQTACIPHLEPTSSSRFSKFIKLWLSLPAEFSKVLEQLPAFTAETLAQVVPKRLRRYGLLSHEDPTGRFRVTSVLLGAVWLNVGCHTYFANSICDERG